MSTLIVLDKASTVVASNGSSTNVVYNASETFVANTPKVDKTVAVVQDQAIIKEISKVSAIVLGSQGIPGPPGPPGQDYEVANKLNPVFTYDNNDNVIRIDYSSGDYKLFYYNEEQTIVQLDYVTNEVTKRRVFNYDSQGILTSITDTEIN
jgi:hypothetical protein